MASHLIRIAPLFAAVLLVQSYLGCAMADQDTVTVALFNVETGKYATATEHYGPLEISNAETYYSPSERVRQNWTLEYVNTEDGIYIQFRSRITSNCLRLEDILQGNSYRIVSFDCDGAPHQYWAMATLPDGGSLVFVNRLRPGYCLHGALPKRLIAVPCGETYGSVRGNRWAIIPPRPLK